MRKKEKNELFRMQEVIERDRLLVDKEFFEVLTTDLTKILSEYVELKGDISLTITKNDGLFYFEIKGVSTRLKNFKIAVKEGRLY